MKGCRTNRRADGRPSNESPLQPPRQNAVAPVPRFGTVVSGDLAPEARSGAVRAGRIYRRSRLDVGMNGQGVRSGASASAMLAALGDDGSGPTSASSRCTG